MNLKYLKNKVIAVMVIESLENLESKVSKIIDEGFDIFEITLRTDCAYAAIELIKNKFPKIKVGAGTILTLEQLNKCIELGADFGVSPGLNESIVTVAKSKKFDFIPGIATPSEIEKAMELGLKLVKIFPAEALGGINYINALSAPYHMMSFMPTGGIKEENIERYINHPNVYCVGGTWMTRYI